MFDMFKKKKEELPSYDEPLEDPFKAEEKEEEVGGEKFSVEPPKPMSSGPFKQPAEPKSDVAEIRNMILSIITQLNTIMKKLDEMEKK